MISTLLRAAGCWRNNAPPCVCRSGQYAVRSCWLTTAEKICYVAWKIVTGEAGRVFWKPKQCLLSTLTPWVRVCHVSQCRYRFWDGWFLERQHWWLPSWFCAYVTWTQEIIDSHYMVSVHSELETLKSSRLWMMMFLPWWWTFCKSDIMIVTLHGARLCQRCRCSEWKRTCFFMFLSFWSGAIRKLQAAWDVDDPCLSLLLALTLRA